MDDGSGIDARPPVGDMTAGLPTFYGDASVEHSKATGESRTRSNVRVRCEDGSDRVQGRASPPLGLAPLTPTRRRVGSCHARPPLSGCHIAQGIVTKNGVLAGHSLQVYQGHRTSPVPFHSVPRYAPTTAELGDPPSMATSDKRKQSLYFPEEMLSEIQREAARQDRSLSWIVQKAWKISRRDIMKYPSVNDLPDDGSDDTRGKVE